MENREENKERESGKRTDGLVHIYCGDGKGKTTASVGAAVRAAGSGKKVVIKRFLKNDHSGEVEVLKQIPGITVLPRNIPLPLLSPGNSFSRKIQTAWYMADRIPVCSGDRTSW